jgi:CRISPR-associated protein Cas2
MTLRFVVVVYDISDDKRRTKLHDVLLNYGTPVQYSVFECLVKAATLEKMKAHVARVIKPRQDQVVLQEFAGCNHAIPTRNLVTTPKRSVIPTNAHICAAFRAA